MFLLDWHYSYSLTILSLREYHLRDLIYSKFKIFKIC